MTQSLALVIDKPERSGAYRPYILQALEEVGYRPVVVVLEGPAERCRLHGRFPVITLNLSPSVYRRFNPRVMAVLGRTLKDHGIRLVWVQRYRPWVYLSLLKKFGRSRDFGLLFHVVNLGYFRKFVRRQVLRFLGKETDLWVANSEEVKGDLEGLCGIASSRLRVIWNGVDISRFEPRCSRQEARRRFGLPEDSFIVGMIARFRKEKDQEGLIEAIFRLCRRGKQVFLVLAGGGPKERKLREEVAKKGLQDRVRFFPWVPSEEIPYLLRAFDVFAHPSWKEGMPNAVLEAMASGLPVVVTDAPGVPAIFKTSRRFGFMVPRGQVEALTRALRELYEMPETERKEMGREARLRVEEAFTMEKMCKHFVEVFRELARGRRHA